MRRKFKGDFLSFYFLFLLKIEMLINISIEYYQTPSIFPILLVFTLKEDIHEI